MGNISAYVCVKDERIRVCKRAQYYAVSIGADVTLLFCTEDREDRLVELADRIETVLNLTPEERARASDTWRNARPDEPLVTATEGVGDHQIKEGEENA